MALACPKIIANTTGSGCIRWTIGRARSAAPSRWRGGRRAARRSLAPFRSRSPTNCAKTPTMPVTLAEPARPGTKRLLVVDDHPILRRGLTALIESEPDLAVHGAVSTRVAALEAMRESQPDLAI